MNEVVNSGVMNIASLVVSVVVLLIGLILWFFINRASSRTNEQIELLEALLDQQKRQNALLRYLPVGEAVLYLIPLQRDWRIVLPVVDLSYAVK